MRASKNLRKHAFGLESLAIGGVGHVIQNVAAKKFLMNPKGVEGIARELTTGQGSKGLSGFFSGVKNAFMPERGIIKEHIGNVLNKIPKMTKKERVAAYYLSQGKFNRVAKSGILEKTPRLVALAEEQGIPMKSIISGIRNNSNAVTKQEKVYRNSEIGRIGIAAGKGLKNIPLRNLAIPTASQASGEIVGNVALGAVEPITAIINGAKRLGGDMGKGQSNIQKAYRGMANKIAIKPELDRAKFLASKGLSFGPVEGAIRTYAVNPVTFAMADYANKARLAARKFGLTIR